MGGTKHSQIYTYNLRTSMITRPSVLDRAELKFQKVQQLVQRLPQLNALIGMQMIKSSECVKSDLQSSAQLPTNVGYSTGKKCLGRRTAASSACSNTIFTAFNSAALNMSLFKFALILLTIISLANGQYISSSYMNQMGVVDSRFKNYAPEGEIKLAVPFNYSEDIPVGTLIASVIGKHTSEYQSGKIYYRIDRKTDPKRQFTVGEDGVVRLRSQLDREEIPTYYITVEGFDQQGNTKGQIFMINVMDVNDNGPIPYMVPNPCIFMEHEDPQRQPTCEIRARDEDTAENGPPFIMRVADDFKYSQYLSITFDQSGDANNGSMTVRPIAVFDREQDPGKYLEIPLILSDRKGLTNNISVYVTVGDRNDSDMSDGVTNIEVYSYLGKQQRTMIGHVFVNDLDDWDLGDKKFKWGSGGQVQGFTMAEDGEITMDANMPTGQYILTANVTDFVRNQNAVGTVYVNVIEVTQEAFDNHGVMSIPLGRGGYMSPDVFLRKDAQGTSPKTRFIEKMIEYLGSGTSIQVFSIQLGEFNLQTEALEVINVRFSAFDTKYHSSYVLHGLLAQHQAEFEQAIGAKIIGFGIDMCKFTSCDFGCRTVHSANEEGYLVSANETVILGVNVWSNDSCECPVFKPPKSCKEGLCKNGGVCHNTYPEGFFCECRNKETKGFRCQGKTRSFSGSGFAWYQPMPACTSLNISLQFMTKEADGLLLYNGPLRDGSTEYRDYLVLRLVRGQVEVELSFNDVNVTYARILSSALNDGLWHSIALTQIGKNVELVLDNCAPVDDSVSRNSSCRAVVSTKDDDERLNVNTPLQVGGLAPVVGPLGYPQVIMSKPHTYTGCLRDLVVNGENYDLGYPERSDEGDSEVGCYMNKGLCMINNENYCLHGECIADSLSNVKKCSCDPGYSGIRCDQKIEWVEFDGNGGIEYNMSVYLETKESDIEILVYPGRNMQNRQALGHATNGGAMYVGTYIENSKFGGAFDCGNATLNSSVNLRIEGLRAASNYSYWLQFSRNPVRASLTVDGSYYVSEQLDPIKKPFTINIRELLLGSETVAGKNSFKGCIGTYRFDHQNLPLSPGNSTSMSTEGGSSGIIGIRNSKGIKRGCSMRQTCADIVCTPPFVCVDFWKAAFCTCPERLVPILRPDGTLLRCGEAVAFSKLGITNNAIIIIMVFLGLLLMMVLLMVVYSRRQTPPFAPVRPVEMNCDNIRPYDIEGGGEADNDQYDINGLRKPVMPLEGNGLGNFAPAYPPQKTAPDDRIKNQIANLEADPDATAPYDELRIFEDEGDDVSRLSLESLRSADDGGVGNIDQQDIGKWGPRFENLADIYGKRE